MIQFKISQEKKFKFNNLKLKKKQKFLKNNNNMNMNIIKILKNKVINTVSLLQK